MRRNGGTAAVLAIEHQAAQRRLQIGARDAADATVAEQHGFLGAVAHQRVVDADGAELVDDDGGALPFGRGEEPPQQRGLAAPRNPVTTVTGILAPRSRLSRRPNGPASREGKRSSMVGKAGRISPLPGCGERGRAGAAG